MNKISQWPGLPALLLSAGAISLLLSSCSDSPRVATNSVLANTNCRGITEDIKVVTLSEVASYRGTELLPQSNPAGQTAQLKPGAGAGQDSDLPLLIALSRGAQPSRGYELHLADQAKVVDVNSLEIPVYWTEPDPQKSHPLVTTHPCLVVSVPNTGWKNIEAVDQAGTSLGSLAL